MIYVILKPEHIGELMNRERDQLPVTDPAPIGAIVAVKTSHRRRPTCLLKVTACEPDPDGYTLTVSPTPHEHEPRLLAADSSRGYTSDPRLALHAEPEAIDPDLAETYARAGQERHDWRTLKRTRIQQADRELLATEERIRRARQAAQANYRADMIRDEVKALEHMLRRGRPGSVVLAQLRRVERTAYRDAA